MKVKPVILAIGTILIVGQLSQTEGANIMFFCGMSSYSHRVGIWPLAEKLSDLGHNLTFVSPFPNKVPHPKIHDYIPESLLNFSKSMGETYKFYDMRKKGVLEKMWFGLHDMGLLLCNFILNDEKYIDFLNSSKFDLIFVDALSNECAYGMAYKLKAKIIVFNTADWFPHFSVPFGIPDESSWIPDMIHHYPQDMTMYQRLVTLVVPLYFSYMREVYYFPKLEALFKEKLGIEEIPSFSEIERNASLVFLNLHYAEDYARPLPPNVIPIPGMQYSEKAENVSKELEDFINKGKDGFIYISFGSFADLATFPNSTQDVFINTVEKFKNIQFIWKLNSDGPKWLNLPQNVYSAKWMPQQAILSHPKIQAFITHAGLFGIQESICNGVPLIAFPIFAEQDYNAEKLHHREIGIRLEITTVTEKELEDAIIKILKDEKYRKNMKRISTVFKDRPTKSVDTAVWWTEFVLRHEDTAFLRPSSIHQSWWKRRQLDLWAVIFLTTLVLIRITWAVLKFEYSVLIGRSKHSGSKLKSS